VTTWYGDLANSVFVEDATEDWQHAKPSEDVQSALEREIEAVAGPTGEEEEGEGSGVGVDDRGECPVDGCDGVLIDVFDVNAYIRQANPPPEIQERMRAARDWRLGRLEPPPGMKRPGSQEQAAEAWDEIIKREVAE
jgi:regulator of protease activity HflC (stomatin/prohibitin superfamily)